MKVVEAFSGIGSQSKALSNIGADYEVVATIEWDINAIYAYDIIHNGPQDLSEYENVTKEELIEKLSVHTISGNGKEPLQKSNLKRYPLDALMRIDYAIKRTKNLVSITDVKAINLPDNVDLLTYSFPCQDLSLSGSWHGNTKGIDRDANNRSGMLWEVERIIKEYDEIGKSKPKFLLMENVTNIRSKRHISNFTEWTTFLEEMGYINQIYDLSADNFGIPQKRKRTFMISVLHNGNENLKKEVEIYFKNNNLESVNHEPKHLKNFLRTDYNVDAYRKEALSSTPNYTISRRKIEISNDKLVENQKVCQSYVRTITTKQDRHPNSGVISLPKSLDAKTPFRYLTPRECFMLMGFDEEDYQNLIDNNFMFNRSREFYGVEKLNKLAGNSIVVNVLEDIFKQIIEIQKIYKLQ